MNPRPPACPVGRRAGSAALEWLPLARLLRHPAGPGHQAIELVPRETRIWSQSASRELWARTQKVVDFRCRQSGAGRARTPPAQACGAPRARIPIATPGQAQGHSLWTLLSKRRKTPPDRTFQTSLICFRHRYADQPNAVSLPLRAGIQRNAQAPLTTPALLPLICDTCQV
jgi:hypothetical protein